MDDVTFGRNGRDAERWRLHSVMAINDMAESDVYECLFLIVAKMSLQNRSAPHLPPFNFFDIRALWRSVLSTRVPKCQKINKGGLDQYGPERFEA